MTREKVSSVPKKYQRDDAPFFYPRAISDRLQPVVRQALLNWVARYSVISDALPETPSLLLAYPHGEHADHILFPTEQIGIIGARDYWFRSLLFRMLVATVVDALPVERENPTISTISQEVDWQKGFLQQRKKHLLLYPQGSRIGPAQSFSDLQEQIKSGAAFMARKLQVPVYPVVLHHQEGYVPQKGGTNAWDRFVQSLSSGQLPEKLPVRVEVGKEISIPNNKREDRAFLTQLAQAFWSMKHEPPTR